MSVISAQMVKELRERTGAGMMDCKNALQETNGDFEEAIEYLRKKGQKLSDKRADREANEGVVIAITSEEGTRGIVINLSCETDFVAKNESFVDFAKEIAQIALTHFPSSLEALLDLPFNDELTIQGKVTEQVGVIGEKIAVSKYEQIEAPLVVPYIHTGYKVGVLLGLNQHPEAAEIAGRNVAMQVAAMNPIAVDKDDVAPEVVQKEKEIALEAAKNDPRNEGKPIQILERITIGMINKFYQENTLLNQAYVKEQKYSVKEYLQSVSKGLTVTAFKRVALG